MAEFTFNLNQIKGVVSDIKSASTFTIKGPAGLTQAQAFEIFKKQATTGALVGFKPGDALSAATQAASGLASAQAALAQAQAGVAGALGAGLGSISNLGGISKSIAAAGGAISGSLATTAAGLTGAVGPAVSAVTKTAGAGVVGAVAGSVRLQNALNNSGSMFPQSVGGPLVAAAITQGSVAAKSIETINKTIIGNPVTNTLTTAAFSKVTAGRTAIPAVAPLGPMSVPEVNGVLAQAQTAVNQPASRLSNNKGLGSFGLDAQQLENAGYIKPGTAVLVGRQDATDPPTLQQVLKSPAVWTGKDGIKNVTDLLKNPGKQSLIQQDLMAKGVAGLGAVGIPIKNLSSQGIAGMALNAAKSLPGAEAFAKGLPIPGDAAGALAKGFAASVRNSAFAVNLVNTKMPAAFKQEDIPVPAADTVSRGTVDAASSRVLGNDKVPPPNYGATKTTEDPTLVTEYETKVATWYEQYFNPGAAGIRSANSKAAALQNQQSITQQQYDAVNNEYQNARQAYNVKGPALAGETTSLYSRLSVAQQKTIDAGKYSQTTIIAELKNVVSISKATSEILKQLALKIEGRGANE